MYIIYLHYGAMATNQQIYGLSVLDARRGLLQSYLETYLYFQIERSLGSVIPINITLSDHSAQCSQTCDQRISHIPTDSTILSGLRRITVNQMDAFFSQLLYPENMNRSRTACPVPISPVSFISCKLTLESWDFMTAHETKHCSKDAI